MKLGYQNFVSVIKHDDFWRFIMITHNLEHPIEGEKTKSFCNNDLLSGYEEQTSARCFITVLLVHLFVLNGCRYHGMHKSLAIG